MTLGFGVILRIFDDLLSGRKGNLVPPVIHEFPVGTRFARRPFHGNHLPFQDHAITLW